MLQNILHIIKAAGAAALALTMMGTISGCTASVDYLNIHNDLIQSKYEQSTANMTSTQDNDEARMIEAALQKRYGEEFVCKKTWNNTADGYYSYSFYGLCHPKDDESLLFETLLKGDGTILGDDYASTIISRRFSKIFDAQIGTSLGKHYTYCYNFGDLDDDATGQIIANNEFTLDYYFSTLYQRYDNYDKLGLYYTVCIDTSELPDIAHEEEYDLIVSALENIYAIGTTYDMNLRLYIDLFFVPTDVYDECLNYFANNARRYSFDDIAEGYPKKYNRTIEIEFENNAFNLTKADYISLRKELN